MAPRRRGQLRQALDLYQVDVVILLEKPDASVRRFLEESVVQVEVLAGVELEDRLLQVLGVQAVLTAELGDVEHQPWVQAAIERGCLLVHLEDHEP